MATGELYEIYGDESATDKKQTHMVYGGICLPAQKAAQLRPAIDAWKQELNDPPSEFHWSSLPAHRLATYKEFARGALCHARDGELFFRSIVFKKSELDYKKFHNNDKELGFYKLWYQFVLHAFSAKIPHGSRVRIVLDERATKYSLAELRDCINGGIVKHWGAPRIRIVAIEPGKSDLCHILQMVDILAGAVSHQNNRHRVDLASVRGAAKEILSQHVQQHAGTGPFTSRGSRPGFQVWHFKPSGK